MMKIHHRISFQQALKHGLILKKYTESYNLNYSCHIRLFQQVLKHILIFKKYKES